MTGDVASPPDADGPAATAPASGSVAGRRQWIDALLIPFAVYALTSLVVILGVSFGHAFVRPSPLSPAGAAGPSPLAWMWDGGWYRKIVADGYSFTPTGESAFAFFPAYPLLARAVSFLTRCGTEWALLATAHLCLLAALIVFYRYARLRTGGEPATAQLALLSAAIVPTTFFFRVAYAESLLFLIGALVLLAIERRWHPAWVALLVGLGTAARPSGGALLFPLALYLLQRQENPRWIARVGWLALGCWGIVAFMAFSAVTTGDPIAFVHAQANWRVRPHVPLGEKIFAVLTLGAVRGVYSKNSPFYHGHYMNMTPRIFSLYFANSIYFGCTILAVIVGAAKGWLNRFEVAMAAALVGIPYLAHNYETTMMATGRYMTTVIPTYLVLGHLSRRLPVALTMALVAVSAFMLGAYAALFSMWYWFI